jgi:DNA invertase Pin-like site-specific DNA recombinase
VVRWVDRLGRNYEDVCDAIREFMRRGVVIRTVINNFTFDGSTKGAMQQAVRDALIAFMAATAQAQAEATKAAQRAGIEHAKAKNGTAYLGRKPSYTRQQFAMVRNMLGHDAVGIARLAKETGLSRQTLYRIKDDPASAEAALAAWGMRHNSAWMRGAIPTEKGKMLGTHASQVRCCHQASMARRSKRWNPIMVGTLA